MSHSHSRVQDLRENLLKDEDCVLLSRKDYCNLAISNRTLVRKDQPEARLRGVFDPVTGIHYLIEDEKLFATV